MTRFLLIVLSILSLLFITCSKSGEPGKVDYSKGETALKAGKPAEALKKFSQIDSLNPKSPLGSLGKAEYYLKEGLYIEGIHALDGILTAHRDNWPAWELLIRSAIRLGRDQLAVAYAEQLAKERGENDSTVLLLTQALVSAGELKKAGELLGRTGSGKGNLILDIVSAKYYLHTGDSVRSLAAFDRALEKGLETPSELIAAGDFQGLRGLADSAAFMYRKALEKDPGNYYLKADVAEALIKIGFLNDADKILKEMAPGAAGTHRYYSILARFYDRQGKIWKARQAYEEAVPTFPKSMTVLVNYALIRARSYDMRTAEMYLSTAQVRAESDSLSPIEIEQFVIDYLKEIVDRGIIVPALTLGQSIAASNPGDFRANYVSAGVTLKFSKPEEGPQALANLNASSKESSKWIADVGHVYLRVDSLARARELFMAALAEDRINKRAVLGMLTLLGKENKSAEAIAFLDQLPEAVNLSLEVAVERIALYRKAGELNKAVVLADRLIQNGHRDIDRYRLAVNVAQEMNDSQKSAAISQLCLENNPDDPRAYSLAGDSYLGVSEFEKAGEAIRKAIALDTMSIDGYMLLARMDTLQGQFDSAIAVCKRAAQIDQYAPEAFNAVAWLTLRQGGDPLIAIDQAGTAITYDPANAAYHFTLGWAYYKQGRHDIAGSGFERALQLAPDNPFYNYHAGINYIKDKKPDKAKICLRKALANGLSGQLKSDAEAALGRL